MKILVCISSVPDTTTKISFIDNKSLNQTGVQFIINPYDEIALTRALELKESLTGTVTVINVGSANTEPVIRKALAIGADDAIRINAEPIDALQVAQEIATVAEKGGYDLIFTGRESIDFNSAQVGPMLGELLNLPSIAVVKKLTIEGNQVTAEKEIEGGKEIITAQLPLVVTAQKDLAEPRIPNMRGIMSARTKPLTVVEPSLTVLATNHIRFDLPQPKQACKMVTPGNMDELINLLHTEAKVI